MRKIFRKSKKGIKICRNWTGNFFEEVDYFVSCYENSNRVIYKKNRWAKRPKKCGSLAVFDTLKHAKEFLSINGGCILDQLDVRRIFFTCKYKPSKDVMWNYFYQDHGGQKFDNICFIPEGTIYADKVKILKEIM